MPFTCDEIVQAFREHEAGDGDMDLDDVAAHSPPAGGFVTIALRCPRGPGGGYLRLWGPRAAPRAPSPSGSYVVIEQYNGVVGIRAELAPFLTSVVNRRSDVDIRANPLGYGCGPNYGRYTQAIPSSAMGSGQTYATPASLVQAVVAAFGSAAIPW